MLMQKLSRIIIQISLEESIIVKKFVLCENDYWAAINFKFSHRSYDSNMGPESNQDDDKSPAQTKSQNSINDKTKKNRKENKSQL